jgi:GT2 family glycosyltransferase/peptidoglycan/xylan/chitin deacetylase (PgdA/CDA1 family)/SAM-dependent methyltransferase
MVLEVLAIARNHIGFCMPPLEMEMLMEKSPQVSIVIASYNKKDLAVECLTSLNKMKSSTDFEVIVVDNGSTDGTAEAIMQLKEFLSYEVILLRNEFNLGFSKASNQGARQAQSSILLFLNNDTIAADDFLRKPAALVRSNSVGIVGIQLRFKDNLVQHAGIVFDDRKKPLHSYRMYSSHNPLIGRSRYVQAVTGACLFIRKDLFFKVGGFDEGYLNGWEDIDLCLKVRERGYRVYYCGEVWMYHMEGQTPSRLAHAVANEAQFLQRWGKHIISDSRDAHRMADSLAAAFSNKSKRQLPDRISFAINIGVPDRSHKNWGDIYFARSLSRALKDRGHCCILRYLNEWNRPDPQIHVVIHLKGLSRYAPQPQHLNVLWILNHPELHAIEEINSYDLVLVASQHYFEQVKEQVHVPIFFLSQAGDETVFVPAQKPLKKDIDVLFVGNNYEAKSSGKMRTVVADLLASGRPLGLKVIGKYWEKFIDEQQLIGEFVPWENLPELYGRAKVVLNDHQDSMKKSGFINNRTFDLALMGAFQIGNHVAGLEELGCVTYLGRAEIADMIQYYLDNPEKRRLKAEEARNRCLEYTFARRADFILSSLRALEAPPVEKCGICGYRGGRFLDMGQRRNVRCPQCHSLERQRALWFLLNREAYIAPGKRVLEISPLNKSLFRDYFTRLGCSYVCCDKWRSGNPLDRRDVSWIDLQSDVTQLPFANKAFDLVVMQHVIEEVRNDAAAFSEISRVLADNGTAVLEIPYNRHVFKTEEYAVPGKFGNVRQYGADVYKRLEPFFAYREEAVVDGICFSILKRETFRTPLGFPILLDHPAADPDSFGIRFRSAIDLFGHKGFVPLSLPQINNLTSGQVHYRRPLWLTLDDGQKQDLSEALPILRNRKAYATSFIIPGRMSDPDWNGYRAAIREAWLQIGSHSLMHRLQFTSTKLIDIWMGQAKYRNLFLDGESYGFPVFEFASAFSAPRMAPDSKVVEFCLRYYQDHNKVSHLDYMDHLKRILAHDFPQGIGIVETREQYIHQMEEEIAKARELIQSELGLDAIAFAFPWGDFSQEANDVIQRHHRISLGVSPSKVNHGAEAYSLKRIAIGSSAFREIESALFRSCAWEPLDYRQDPQICVLMTTRNRPETLPEAIQSVVDQTYKDWHLFIVNDGGEDVRDVVESFCDPRIIYHSRAHAGKAAALNFAIAQSRSKYIAYLDDDDRFQPNHLEVLHSYFGSHPDARFVYSAAYEVSETWSNSEWKETGRQVKYGFQGNIGQLMKDNFIPNLCAMHERSLFEEAGCYDEHLEVLIDWDMYRRLSVVSPPHFVNCITAEYRLRNSLKNDQLMSQHLTSLYTRDIVRYYQNRLRITGNLFCQSRHVKTWPESIVLCLTAENVGGIGTLLSRCSLLRAQHPIDIVLLVGGNLDQKIVSIVRYAELLDASVIWNYEGFGLNQFVDSFFKNVSGWKKCFFVEPPAELTKERISKNGVSHLWIKISDLNELCRLVCPDCNVESVFAGIKGMQTSGTHKNGRRQKALLLYSAPVEQIRQILYWLRSDVGDIDIHLFGKENKELIQLTDTFIPYKEQGSYKLQRVEPASLEELEKNDYDLAIVPLNNYEGRDYGNITEILQAAGIQTFFTVNPALAVERKTIVSDARHIDSVRLPAGLEAQ